MGEHLMLKDLLKLSEKKLLIDKVCDEITQRKRDWDEGDVDDIEQEIFEAEVDGWYGE